MPYDPDDVPKSDLAFLEGRLLRLESEQKAIRRIHGDLANELERLSKGVRELREENSRSIDPWRENTDIRNQRRAELESLRARALVADEAEIMVQREKGAAIRRLAILGPSIGAVLYALAEFIRSFVHH